MTSPPNLGMLFNEALNTLKKANKELEADKESANKLYEKGLKQYSKYKKGLEKKYQLLEETIQPYFEKFEASRGSSETDFVKLNAVGGLKNCKQVLIEAALWPIKYPKFFTGNRKPWRAVLLFGPPGTGKTLLAKTIAAVAKFKFFSISPSDILSKYMGKSEQHVSNLFHEARKEAPSIIFVDEIDSLCGPRGENNENEPSRRIKSELLVHMQGVCDGAEHVLILAATNTPYALDKAIRRRFDMRIYIPLPNDEARKQIFEVEIGNTPSEIDAKGLESLAKGTKGFSGSDISSYVKDALYQCIRPTLRADFFKKSSPGLEKDGQNSEVWTS